MRGRPLHYCRGPDQYEDYKYYRDDLEDDRDVLEEIRLRGKRAMPAPETLYPGDKSHQPENGGVLYNSTCDLLTQAFA